MADRMTLDEFVAYNVAYKCVDEIHHYMSEEEMSELFDSVVEDFLDRDGKMSDKSRRLMMKAAERKENGDDK